MGFLGLFGLLFYLAIIVFILYIVITAINLMKQRNDYLRDIRDELRKGNEQSGRDL